MPREEFHSAGVLLMEWEDTLGVFGRAGRGGYLHHQKGDPGSC